MNDKQFRRTWPKSEQIIGRNILNLMTWKRSFKTVSFENKM